MQISADLINSLRGKMKAHYPNQYALIVLDKLRLKHVCISRQQVYNFFNHLPVTHKNEIINATIELLQEAKINQITKQKSTD